MKNSNLAFIFITLLHIGFILNNGVCFSYGQDNQPFNNTNFGWANFGVGISNFDASSSSSSSFGASYSFSNGKKILSARFVANIENGIRNPSENIWDVGVLYGFCGIANYGLASISAGISLVGGTQRGELLTKDVSSEMNYEKVDYYTVGIPFECQLFLIVFPSFGIGTYGFANLNFKKSYCGILFCIQLGGN